MEKHSKWNRWWIAITITVITLIVIITYLYDTNRLELLWKFEWKSFSEFEQKFLGSAFGVILLSWVATLSYNYIFPNSVKKLFKGQEGIKNKVDEGNQQIAEISKFLKQSGARGIDPRDLLKLINEIPLNEGAEKCQKLIFKWYEDRKISAMMKIALEDLTKFVLKIIEDSRKVAISNLELQQQFENHLINFEYAKARSVIDDILNEHKNIKEELAKLHYQKAVTYNAEITYQKAKEELETAVALDKTNPEILHQYAFTLHTLGVYDQAIEYYEKSLKINLKTLGDEHQIIATSYNNIGLAWDSKGDYDKSIEYYEKALKIDLKIFGDEHPDTAINYNNIGLAWFSKGEYDKAIDYYEKALKIDLKIFSDEHPKVAIRYNNIGGVWDSKGDYDKAIDYYEKALKIDLKVFGAKHPNTATDYNNLGGTWFSKGEYDKAIELYEKTLKILRKVHPNGHPYINITEESLKLAKQAKNN